MCYRPHIFAKCLALTNNPSPRGTGKGLEAVAALIELGLSPAETGVQEIKGSVDKLVGSAEASGKSAQRHALLSQKSIGYWVVGSEYRVLSIESSIGFGVSSIGLRRALGAQCKG